MQGLFPVEEDKPIALPSGEHLLSQETNLSPVLDYRLIRLIGLRCQFVSAII